MANPLGKLGEIVKLYHSVENELQHAARRIEVLESLNRKQDERVRGLNDRVIVLEADRQSLIENCCAAAATTATNIFAKSNGPILERIVRVEMKIESIQGSRHHTEASQAESLLRFSSSDVTRRAGDAPL